MTGSLLGPLDYMFGETLRVAIAVAVVIAGGVLVAARVRGWTFERVARTWLLLTSLSTIALFTQHNPFGGSGRVLDLNPFGDLRVAADTAGRYRDIVVANVALFIPLGVALAWRGTRFVKTAAFGAAISILAEAVQYAADHGRVAQSGDVIVNVAGAVVGWALFVALTGGWGPLSRAYDPPGSELQRRQMAATSRH
ncbi:MAG TPA: VanZ family protein [Candidatus Limnocylindrales bacterium]|nr:VanZ family protein [Candidatus Limnocylindrales bacterium]